MRKTKKTLWSRANAAFRNKDLESALTLYEEALAHDRDALNKHIKFNIDLTLRRLKRLAPVVTLEKPENLEEYFFNLIKQGGFFDPGWYLAQYQNKHNVSGNPLAHYLDQGVALSTNPSPYFDTAYYIKTHQDVTQAGINPFLHYVCQGRKEDRLCLPSPPPEYVAKYSVSEPKYIPRLPIDTSPVEKAVRAIAFYLPQFHAIPENDKWWGKDFTEWTNVKPAKPQFEGHYQPRVPDEFLGYYNLLERETQAKQIELAKQYGVEGFCFYLYWFSGHRLLEQPVDNYLGDPTLDFPFCVCWANENWSRRWDGLDNDLLMEQHYSSEDDINFISNVAKYLRDPRYIRVNGKPLLLIYRPNLFPDMRATVQRWRAWCQENGVGEIYLTYPQSFECVDPAEYGFDAACEFPPNNSAPPNITQNAKPIVEDFQSTVYDWRILVERSESYQDPGYTLFRSATPSWDNTARKKNKGAVFHNSCPTLFEKWLINAFADTLVRYKNSDEQIVFINAWNEWAEGAHLEPDRRYGYAWLQALKNAHQQVLSVQNSAASPVPLLEKPDDLDEFVFDKIKASGLFQPEWYLERYRKSHQVSGNPLAHYLKYGVVKSLNPSGKFNTAYYLKANPDVANAGIHPFIHYVLQGIREGRIPISPELYCVEPAKYVPRLPIDAPVIKKSVKVISFYLPQFHPIPENDAWWGKGFTEWTNVMPAKPQFEGHYQPHIPDDFLGYYDLRDTNVMRKQIELAKQYGIEGFCFYSYWFSGHRLLETPVDNYLADSTLNLPFCICWANENWSRRWDGQDHEILIAQEYSEEDDIAFIQNVSKYLKDSRYIRIHDRPLLLVYRPNIFPDIKKTTSRWREWCKTNGVGEIYLAYPQSFSDQDPAEFGMDAAIDFPPSGWYARQELAADIKPIVDQFEGTVYDWRFMLARSDAYRKPEYKLFRGATPSWDNTARRKNKGTVFHHSGPKLFTKWLTNAFTDTLIRLKDPDEQIVFVNAWNEWAEGAHLEPDQKYGYAWLQAVRDAHQAALERCPRVVLVSHNALPHGAQILCLNFARYFKEQFHYEVDIIVLGEGGLISKYQEYANVYQLKLDGAENTEIDVLLASLRNRGAEIAIVNTTVSGPLVPHLKEHGFSVVSLVHEMPGILTSYKLNKHAEQIADYADKVIFPAQEVQDGFEAFIGRTLAQAVIRPQGLYLRSLLRQGADKGTVSAEVRKQLGLAENAKIILCAGYADHRKGFDLFVQACIQVMQQVPDTYALWVGHLNQSFVDQSMDVAVTAGLRDRFLFTGLVEYPQAYYLAAQVYALTSREDPFPSVVMEALDGLTPVVAFKGCGGFENLLKRDCGVLVPAEDHAAFAMAMVDLLKNPQQASTLAATGRTIVESEFSFCHYLFDLLTFSGHPIPRVSVVVPNYKYEKYIRRRLESVINQTYPIFELIVLDDCSPDDSVVVINDFLKGCEVPHRLVINETNSGSVFRQWQKGVEMARGDLVWIAEADDLADPGFLEKLLPFFKDPRVVLAYSQSMQIDENDQLLANDYLAYTNDVGDYWVQDYVVDGEEEIKRALCIKNTIPNVSGVLFKREQLLQALQAAKDDMMALKVAGDWVLYLQLAARGKVAYHSNSLNMHRRHVHSVTKVNNHLEEVVAVQKLAVGLATIAPEQLSQMKSYVQKLEEYFGQVAEAL